MSSIDAVYKAKVRKLTNVIGRECQNHHPDIVTEAVLAVFLWKIIPRYEQSGRERLIELRDNVFGAISKRLGERDDEIAASIAEQDQLMIQAKFDAAMRASRAIQAQTEEPTP